MRHAVLFIPDKFFSSLKATGYFIHYKHATALKVPKVLLQMLDSERAFRDSGSRTVPLGLTSESYDFLAAALENTTSVHTLPQTLIVRGVAYGLSQQSVSS
jgi:hypothetical protein